MENERNSQVNERGRTYEQVGDETVLSDGSEGEDVILRRLELSGDEEKTTKGDEDVATPGASPLRVRDGVGVSNEEEEWREQGKAEEGNQEEERTPAVK